MLQTFKELVLEMSLTGISDAQTEGWIRVTVTIEDSQKE